MKLEIPIYIPWMQVNKQTQQRVAKSAMKDTCLAYLQAEQYAST